MVASVTFNGLSLDVDPYHLEVVEGLLASPELRVSDRPLVARDGMVTGRDYYSGRAVTMTVNISASDSTALGTAVAAFKLAFAAPQAAELPLSFTIPGVAGGTAARLNVRPRKVALPIGAEYFGGVGRAAVELYATDPLIYSDTETVASIVLASGSSGMTFNMTFDLTFGAAISYGSSTLTNQGSATAPVVIRVYGPVTNPTVRNVTTGQSLAFTATLVAGEFIDIDTTDRTVLLNGTADRYSYLTTPQWWGLQPGTNEIRYFADIASASTATVTYRSAWI